MQTNKSAQEIIDFVFETGKKKIEQAGMRTIDFHAKNFCDLLWDLDETEKAKELYQLYRKLWP